MRQKMATCTSLNTTCLKTHTMEGRVVLFYLETTPLKPKVIEMLKVTKDI